MKRVFLLVFSFLLFVVSWSPRVVMAACTPNCGAKVCGDDGCGGSCGACGVGQACDPTQFVCKISTDWPQLQNNPQHTGYSFENVNLLVSNAWAKGFSPERLFPQVQPIVVGGKVFIGTEMGTFYALDAKTGAVLWRYTGAGPILGTAGVENGVVFFGSMDGAVYALNAGTGALVWKFNSGSRAGFSSSVVLAEGKVFIPNRAGVFYALNQTNGSIAWQTNLGAPVFMSPAYDNGKVFVGAMDMKVYALSTANGAMAWQAGPVRGAAFKDYWPMAYQGLVFIRPMKVYADVINIAGIAQTTGPLPQSELDRQGGLLTSTGFGGPPNQDLFVFDQNSGAQVVLPHYGTLAMNGAVCPPAVDGDGKIIAPVIWSNTYGSGWGRLDVTAKRITEVLWDGAGASGNNDESMCPSAAGRLVFLMHRQEENAQFTGVWNLDQRKATRINAYIVEQYFRSNTQGGGTNPVSISNGYIYHTNENTLNARKGS